jgi:hypothetical protein
MLEESGSHAYIDVGPSGTLANLVKPLLREGSGSFARATLTPFGWDVASFHSVFDDGGWT